MWFALAVERDRSWSAALQQTDPRHPGYNGTQAKVTPDPVIVEIEFSSGCSNQEVGWDHFDFSFGF